MLALDAHADAELALATAAAEMVDAPACTLLDAWTAADDADLDAALAADAAATLAELAPVWALLLAATLADDSDATPGVFLAFSLATAAALASDADTLAADLDAEVAAASAAELPLAERDE